jgi:Fe-S-cluster containining protein
MCGDCCRGYGGTYVTEADIAAIAAYLGQDPASFVEKCCRLSGSRQLLAQGPTGHCLFWDRLCTIHPVKPAMCRAWPFIKSVLVDVGNWHSMATCCPGMRTDVSDDAIKERVRSKLSESGEAD